MKSCCFIALLTFVTITCCLGLKPSEAVADGHTSEVIADDNAGKFGIGFHSTFPFSGISGKYWTPTGIGVQGFLVRAGFSLPIENLSGSLTTLGGRYLHTIQRKSRVRLYLGGGASYTNATGKLELEDEEETTDGEGFGLEGVGGVEYSFSDLPNLGFAFEFGIGFLRLSSSEDEDEVELDLHFTEDEDEVELDLHFTTSGTVGIHYYF